MEVKINKEIRNYSENIFFGLSLRQFIFSILACISALILFFIFKPVLGTEITSWICIIGATPFGLMGFVKYNGMTGEQFILAYIKSEFLTKRELVFESTNFYYELINTREKEKTNEDERKMNYDELRHKIHDILGDFLYHEIEIYNAGEFDFEYMEFRTDDILHLIKRQGGTY